MGCRTCMRTSSEGKVSGARPGSARCGYDHDFTFTASFLSILNVDRRVAWMTQVLSWQGTCLQRKADPSPARDGESESMSDT